MATVKLATEAAEQLNRLPKKMHKRCVGLLKRLERWPDVSGVRALTGNLQADIGCALGITACVFALLQKLSP